MKLYQKLLSASLFVSLVAFFTHTLVAGSGGPGQARFFFTDPQNYSAGGAVIVLKKDNSTGVVTDITLDNTRVTLKKGNYFYGKLAPDCTGILEFEYPPANIYYSYELKWVKENNLYPNNAQIVSTNFFKFEENFLTGNLPYLVMLADLKVNGYDYDNNGTVTTDELLQTRAQWAQNCGFGGPVFYGIGGSPTPTMTSPTPSIGSTSPTPTIGTTSPTPTLRPTATATPTRVPTATATPTPGPSSFETVGFVNPGSVGITVPAGSNTFIFNLTSLTANQFAFYGYPTSYGPGINTPASGGITPGTSVPITLNVISTVIPGTYTGMQKLTAGPAYPYALIPFTVTVMTYVPTPTPTLRPTITPTRVPTPTATATPTPAFLTISGVGSTIATSNSAIVFWNTNLPASSMVKYGTASNRLTLTSGEIFADSIYHTVKLSGLVRRKTYYYQVYSRDYFNTLKTDGKTYSFTTLK
jgi:hypothetical protein